MGGIRPQTGLIARYPGGRPGTYGPMVDKKAQSLGPEHGKNSFIINIREATK